MAGESGNSQTAAAEQEKPISAGIMLTSETCPASELVFILNSARLLPALDRD
jgi:hypothetical protein